MKQTGYSQSNTNHTLFYERKGKQVTCLIIYVDDMFITRSDQKEIEELQKRLFTEFELKDLRNLKYFLGIKVL